MICQILLPRLSINRNEIAERILCVINIKVDIAVKIIESRFIVLFEPANDLTVVRNAYGRDPNYLILKKSPCKHIQKNDYHGGKHYPDLWIHDLYVSVKLIGRCQRIHIFFPKNLFCQNDPYLCCSDTK